MTDKVQKIKDWISCQQDSLIDTDGNFQHSEDEAAYHTLCSLDAYINFIQEEPVSEDLEEACEQLAENARKHKAETSSPFFCQTDYRQGVMDGAQWQKEQMMAKAIDARCFGFQDAALFSFRLPADNYLVGSEVKVIIIKED